MTTWICRLLILVFVFNICSPEMLFAQQHPSQPKGADLYDAVSAQIDQQRQKPLSQAQNADELEALYAGQKQELTDLYNHIEADDNMMTHAALDSLVEQMHQLAEAYEKARQKFPSPSALDPQALSAQLRRNAAQPQDTIAPTGFEDALKAVEQLAAKQTKEKDFLAKLKADQLSLIDLVEYVDPLGANTQDPASLLLTAYAAEVFLNSIYPLLIQTDETQKAEWQKFMPRLQQRVMYRLNHLPTGSETEDIVMARGSLRILLTQIHRFYEQEKRQDPLTTVYKEENTFVALFAVVPTQDTYRRYLSSIHKANAKRQAEGKQRMQIPLTYEQYCRQHGTSYPSREAISSVPQGYEIKDMSLSGSAVTVEQNDQIFAKFMDDFIKETYHFLAEKKMKPTSGRYALLDLHVQYATRYALMANRLGGIPSLVAALEANNRPTEKNGVFKPTKFQTDYADILETLFGVITETTKGFPLPPQVPAQLAALLSQMAGPEHATITRVEAITTASLLHRADHWTTPGMPVKTNTINKIEFDQPTRDRLARYAVDLYAPMSYKRPGSVYREDTPNRPTETYGLDAHQMQVLQDQLVSNISGLLPITAPKTVWDEVRQIYVADTANPVELPYIRTQEYTSANGSGTIPTFLFDSEGKAFDVYIHNPVNRKQAVKEEIKPYARLLLEAAVWVLGGEVLIFGFRALRMTGGAVAMFPSAAKAARTAQKGQKASAFAQNVSKGWRYGSPAARANHLGATVSATRTEQVRAYTEASAAQTQARTSLGGLGQAVKVDVPVTRVGFGYSSPTAIDITGADARSAGFWQRLFNPATPEVQALSVTQGGETYTLTAKELADLGITNKTHFSLQDQIKIWEKWEQMGLNTNPFGYKHPTWLHPFDAKRWFGVRLGKTDAAPASAASRAKGTAAAGKNPYEILGLKEGATRQEIRTARNNLAKQYHPDVSQADADKIKEINAAYNLLTKGGYAGTTAANAGLLPMNRWHSAADVTKDGLKLAGQSFWTNLKFFAGWEILDRMTNVLQQPMLNSAIEKQTKEALEPYGDLFTPALQTENQPQEPAQDPLAKVNAAAHNPNEHAGALITTPIFAARLAAGWQILPESLHARLRVNAKRIELGRAIQTRRDVRDQKDFDAYADSLYAQLDALRQSYVAAYPQNPPVAMLSLLDNYTQALKQIAQAPGRVEDKVAQVNQTIARYSALLEKEEVNLWFNDQQQDLALAKTLVAQVEDLTTEEKADWEALFNKTLSALEKARKKSPEQALIAGAAAMDNQYWQGELLGEIYRQQSAFQNGSRLYFEQDPQLLARADQLWSDTEKQLRALLNSALPEEKQLEQLVQIIGSWEQELYLLYQELPFPDDEDWDELYPDAETDDYQSAY